MQKGIRWLALPRFDTVYVIDRALVESTLRESTEMVTEGPKPNGSTQAVNARANPRVIRRIPLDVQAKGILPRERQERRLTDCA